MEFYQLNLPNGIVSNIVDYSYDEEDECDECQIWRHYSRKKRINLTMKRTDERNVEDDIIIVLSVYNIPPYDYVHQFLRISKKRYEMKDHILWMLVCYENEERCKRKYEKLFIESKKFNIKIKVKDTNIIIQMMYEKSKEYRMLSHHQLNYCPELKL